MYICSVYTANFKQGKVMRKNLLVAATMLTILSGCASVPMESKDKSDLAKKFSAPSAGIAGLYVYRSGSFGGALKKDVLLDGKCVGETAPNVFFYNEISGNEEHKVSTESEFSLNDLLISAEIGKNYFVRQYMKMGVFVGGAGVELVSNDKGKKEVSKLNMAKKGYCSK